MRLVRTITLGGEVEDDETEGKAAARRVWRWYVRPQCADDDGSQSARRPVALEQHLCDTEQCARRMVRALGLEQPEARAVILAARWHDNGKRRAVWQKSIGNQGYLSNPPVILAKGGARMRTVDLSTYRHEFGSLLDVASDADFRGQPSDVRDLVLHLIAAHHGRARPHFPMDECFDCEPTTERADSIAAEVPRRFARLQRDLP